MAVYREGYYAIKEIQKASKQIYPDACDYGVLVKKGDSIWNLAKQLGDWYGDKNTRVVNKYSTGTSSDITVTLIDEWAVSDEVKTISQATENYHLSYVTCNDKGYDGIISVTKF